MARPLDKIVKGVRLTRDPAIEATIDVARTRPLETLRARAAIVDKQSPDYLPFECLVHLIRHAIRQSNGPLTHNAVANGLLPFLLKRCEANLKVKVSDRIATAQDIREEILTRLALMFANEAAPDGKYRLGAQVAAKVRIAVVTPRLEDAHQVLFPAPSVLKRMSPAQSGRSPTSRSCDTPLRAKPHRRHCDLEWPCT